MLSSSPGPSSLSRSRLKALATWVRDELDHLVAREGPNVLRPNDVLILHETLTALRHASDITALDLRATGIHRAVQDIAGVATRWPSRLCDDCDEIIQIWTAKFGPLGELYPFLYGRGGRLEGISSAEEYSRETLLKRWSENCPEKLHPKLSHRVGDLGFKAGDWWINPLFAHHAGIIGLEAVEGGTTFDKNGAYALMLKDTGEVEACEGDAFTYRVPQWDKGKYRLTAATPRSRDPIRVLRSHSINSVWGPKAGVRYEGLFSVTGWSIRQAKFADTTGSQWKLGDILFEVRFERRDPIPMDLVIIRPTATEVDDYAEYKRIQKLRREGKRKGPGGTSNGNIHVPRKAAPPIAPPQSAPTFPPPSPDLSSQSKANKALLRHLNLSPEPSQQIAAPPSFPSSTHLLESPRKQSTLLVPGRRPIATMTSIPGDQSPVPSNASANSAQSLIREVAPWVDFDVALSIPSPDKPSPPAHTDSSIHGAELGKDFTPASRVESMAPSIGTGTTGSVKSKDERRQKGRTIVWQRERRKSGDFRIGGLLSPGTRVVGKVKELRKGGLLAKIGKGQAVDGPAEMNTDDEDLVEADERREGERQGDGADIVDASSCSRPVDGTKTPPKTDWCIPGREKDTRFPSPFGDGTARLEDLVPAALTSKDEDSVPADRVLRAEYGGVVFANPFRVKMGEVKERKEREDSMGVAPDWNEGGM